MTLSSHIWTWRCAFLGLKGLLRSLVSSVSTKCGQKWRCPILIMTLTMATWWICWTGCFPYSPRSSVPGQTAGDTSTRLLSRYLQLSLTSQRLWQNGVGFSLPLRAGAGCRTAAHRGHGAGPCSGLVCVLPAFGRRQPHTIKPPGEPQRYLSETVMDFTESLALTDVRLGTLPR